MYHARRNFTLKGVAVKIGDQVDLSDLTRPESLVRSGFVEWKGQGARDKIHPEAFTTDFYAVPAFVAKKTRKKKGVTILESVHLDSVSLDTSPSLFPVAPPKVLPLKLGKKVQ